MQNPDPHRHRQSSLQRLYAWWWGSSRRHWAGLEDIDQLRPAEIAVMAAEVGVSSDEFLRTARQPNGLLRLLNQRLAALGLDPEEIRKLSPLLLGELRRTCALCAEKQRCADDTAEESNPPGWESYCPNAGTLRHLF